MGNPSEDIDNIVEKIDCSEASDDVFEDPTDNAQGQDMDDDDDSSDNVPEPMPLAKRGQRKSSIFDLPTGRFGAHPARGDSIVFSNEPHEEIRPKKISYENTYQMEPPRRFKPDLALSIIKDALEHSLHDRHYDPIACALISKNVAHEIKQRVKCLNFQRYKIVVTVSIGEKNDQGVRIGSRCVWNTDWDTFATANFENNSLYAVGTVYALYYE